MNYYSPFDKYISEIEIGDLEKLRMVSEGFYVEYKRETPSTSAIAKSISAFANTYGGWTFYGVEEGGDEKCAAAFPGIARGDIDQMQQRIRQAVAALIAPAPYFEEKVLWGPCNPIGLGIDHAVICVWTPMSVHTPHLHKEGRIYRRVGASSEPEKDRYQLDQLWRRAEEIRGDFRHWVDKDPEFTPQEADRPYIRLLLQADLWGSSGLYFNPSMSEFKSIMNESDRRFGIPFDTIYRTSSGFVARQVHNNDPSLIGLTWIYWYDLGSEVIIPLNCWDVENLSQLRPLITGRYVNGKEFLQILNSAKYRSCRILDLNGLLHILIGVLGAYTKLATLAGWNGNMYAKAKLLNVARSIPFIDSDSVLSIYREHGVPYILRDMHTINGGTDPETFFIVGNAISDDSENSAMNVNKICEPILKGLGVPGIEDFGTVEAAQRYYQELLEAGERALKSQAG